MALLVGAAAPDFTLEGWYGSGSSSYSLSSQRGHPVVLAFYPGDERLVCTRQLCAYSDNIGDLHLFDAVVWGISSSSIEAHRDFAEGRKLKMPLLSDVGRAVAKDFGIIGPMGLRRSVFVIDGAGRVAWRWVAAVNLMFPGLDVVRDALADLRAAA